MKEKAPKPWKVINKNREKTICFIVILILFLGSLISLEIPPNSVFYTTYSEDYYSVLTNTEYPYYRQIIEEYGEPDKTIREKYTEHGDYLIYNEYDDGRLFVFSYNENSEAHPSLGRIEVTSPEYRFGRKKIGVGTDKSTLEKIYRRSYQGLQQDPLYERYFVEDGNFVIDFYFDENDRVYKLTVGKADIMHGVRGWKKK